MKETYLPDVYVKISDRILERLISLEKTKKLRRNRNKINIKELNLNDNEIWDYLDGLKIYGRSGRGITFRRDTSPKIAQLLGFIITDGSLISTAPKISLGQIDETLLRKYLEIISTEYCINLDFNFDGKETKVISSPLRFILHKYYNIPLGKKVRIVEVPPQILESKNNEVIQHFVAGLFDGDGYIQYYFLKDKKILDHASFCISTSSHDLIKQTTQLLEKVGISCSISKRNDDGRLTLQTAGFENTLKFYEQIIPLIFHKERKEISNKVIRSNDFKEKLVLSLNPNLKLLFKEIRDKKLESELINSLASHHYINSLRSIESWTYPSKQTKVRSIYVYNACRLLNKNPKNYIPPNHLNLIEGLQNDCY